MDDDEQPTTTVADSLDQLRHHHPAWRLLAARRGPLVLGCLRLLFESENERVTVEDAVQLLSSFLAEQANNPDYDITTKDYARLARAELRSHIKSKLLVERSGELSATDSLKQVFNFVGRIEHRMMSSTASRLATVQHQISEVATRLNPDPGVRAKRIREQIADLEAELGDVEKGDVEVLAGDAAVEAIREVYSLAMSLHDDFGRVQDSYRQADQDLRVSIIREQQHRGQVVDRLLESHDRLVETSEGKVFDAFYAQLNESDALQRMSTNLARLLEADAAEVALDRRQRSELRQLRSRLVNESNGVVHARARSERDVRNYLRTGLGFEHQRVGQLLDQVLEHALDIDWEQAAIRRSVVPLPVLGPTIAVPVAERLRVKDIDADDPDALDFRPQPVDLDNIDQEFWQALDGLDRQALAADTVEVLRRQGRPMTMAELAILLPPTHDLETISVWVEMAQQANATINDDDVETLDVEATAEGLLRFRVPTITFDPEPMAATVWEL